MRALACLLAAAACLALQGCFIEGYCSRAEADALARKMGYADAAEIERKDCLDDLDLDRFAAAGFSAEALRSNGARLCGR